MAGRMTRRIAGLVRKAIAFELATYRSLYRWIRRRTGASPAAKPFGYARSVTPIIWVFIIVSAVEIPVAHVLLPWEWAEVLSLVLGLWGLTWMFGLLTSMHVYPHLLGTSGLRVRHGSTVDITVPWDAVAEIRTVRRDLPSSRAVHLEPKGAENLLSLGVSSQTNVEVVFREPQDVPLPRGTETVSELRFYADDPQALVLRAREHLTTGV